MICAEMPVELQVHEWSGVFKNTVMAGHFRRFRPGLRFAVNLFGGHYWRTQVRGNASQALCQDAILPVPAHRFQTLQIFPSLGIPYQHKVRSRYWLSLQ